jgi:hypothetical protein
MHLIPWIGLALNAALLVITGANNIAVGHFMISRTVISKTRGKETRERMFVIRIFITTATNIFVCVTISVIQVLQMYNILTSSSIIGSIQLCSVLLNALINPVINTFSTYSFRQRLISLFKQGL